MPFQLAAQETQKTTFVVQNITINPNRPKIRRPFILPYDFQRYDNWQVTVVPQGNPDNQTKVWLYSVEDANLLAKHLGEKAWYEVQNKSFTSDFRSGRRAVEFLLYTLEHPGYKPPTMEQIYARVGQAVSRLQCPNLDGFDPYSVEKAFSSDDEDRPIDNHFLEGKLAKYLFPSGRDLEVPDRPYLESEAAVGHSPLTFTRGRTSMTFLLSPEQPYVWCDADSKARIHIQSYSAMQAKARYHTPSLPLLRQLLQNLVDQLYNEAFSRFGEWELENGHLLYKLEPGQSLRYEKPGRWVGVTYMMRTAKGQEATAYAHLLPSPSDPQSRLALREVGFRNPVGSAGELLGMPVGAAVELSIYPLQQTHDIKPDENVIRVRFPSGATQDLVVVLSKGWSS